MQSAPPLISTSFARQVPGVCAPTGTTLERARSMVLRANRVSALQRIKFDREPIDSCEGQATTDRRWDIAPRGIS